MRLGLIDRLAALVRVKRPAALPMRELSPDVTGYTWEDWKADAKAAHPLRYFLGDTLPMIIYRAWNPGRLGWYWLVSHTWRRFHKLDIRNRYYRWGYLDRDAAMLYACFQCLVEFVEDEDPFEVNDWDWDEKHRAAAQEIKDLYKWWTEGRASEQADAGTVLGEDDRDDEQLARLIKIRGYLWT